MSLIKWVGEQSIGEITEMQNLLRVTKDRKIAENHDRLYRKQTKYIRKNFCAKFKDNLKNQ